MFKSLLTAALASVLLTGCASQPPVELIVKDPAAAKRTFGWKKPDMAGRRVYRVVRDPNAKPLPYYFTLWLSFPPVQDQGDLGSCTGHGWAGEFDHCRIEQGLKPLPASRLFIYWCERQIEGSTADDSGAAVQDGIRALSAYGVCPEGMWPYATAKFNVKPPDAAWTAALGEKVAQYHAVDTTDLHTVKSEIFARHGVVFGFTCYPEMQSAYCARTGNLIPSLPSEQPIGGHCVVATGWDDGRTYVRNDGSVGKGMIQCRNSWSAGWGDKGRLWIPYSMFTDPAIVSDAWVATLVPAKSGR